MTTTLYLYKMLSNTFSLFDAIAGYYISNSVVIPLQQQIINQPIEKLSSQNVELRLLPSQWQLHDAVANSTQIPFNLKSLVKSRSRFFNNYFTAFFRSFVSQQESSL